VLRILLITFTLNTGLATLYLAATIPRVRLVSPAPTPLLEDRNGHYLAEGTPLYERLGFWEVPTPLPRRIKACILAVEDRRFYSHGGIDLRAMARALYHNIFLGQRQGASTIAMQVARMQHPARRNIWNKTREIGVAFLLIQRYGHDEVLRHYMRIVPQGNQIYGFTYAARRFFRKPLQDLSWTEAALLASLPKAPDRYSIFRFEGFLNSLERARLILKLLQKTGRFDEETYRQSLRELGRFPMPVREARPSHSYHFILRILDDHTRGAGEKNLTDPMKPIRTTLDTELQEYLQWLAERTMHRYRSFGVGNIAIIVAERKTGEVLGYIGSEDYFDEEASGAINYATTSRSAGSTLKPFIFALGLETGTYTPASVLADLPFHVVGLDGQYSYSYSNIDSAFLGPMLYRRALANSRNIPVLRVLERIGLRETYDFLGKLGLHTGERSAEYYGYGMAIGGLYVTLEDLVRCYGVLANNGLDYSLKWFSGRSESTDEHQILSERTARQITLFLSDPLARLPSFPRLSTLEAPFPVAIKTGTSMGYRDAWALAYSTRYIVGVWLGHPENEPMNRIGSFDSAGLVQNILLYLQPEESRGINEELFAAPRDSVAVRICLLSGQVAKDDCPTVSLEHFGRSSVPTVECQVHRRFAVDRKDGTLADASSPPRRVVTRAFTVLPPEYASWGARMGYGPPPRRARSVRTASLRIVEPPHGSRYVIDPETPRDFQTLPLRVEVSPAVAEVVWIVDGREYERVSYPYETRWSLEEGRHTFQARFPKANVMSEVISVDVSSY
jgi:penicillin-binding protein 1C